MNFKLILLFCLFALPIFGQQQECTNCDTTFYYRKKPFGELEKLYPIRIICYFKDEVKGATNQKCWETEWKDGKKDGVEKKFLYEDTIYLLNLWGKPFKSHAAEWRKNMFGAKVQRRPLEYKGYWKAGQKHGIWYYYNHSGNRVKVQRIEKYKKGTLRKSKDYKI